MRYRYLIYVFLLCSHWLSAQNGDVIVIGHRGAKGHVTENTMPSIRKAIDLGVDMIEIDVFKCATGELVVFHDKSLKRLAGIRAGIEDLSLDSIRNIDLGNGKTIPTLPEVIATVDGRVKLNIELKGRGTAVDVRFLIDSVLNDSKWSENDFLVSSFKKKELNEYRQVSDSARIALLTLMNPLWNIRFAEKIEALAIIPRHGALNERRINKAHERGFRIYTWTVNDVGVMREVIGYGADGIITDYPDRLIELKRTI